MSKGPSSKSESKTELPAWYVPYAKQGLEIGNKIAQQGYTPYQGPDVAAFTPQQVQGMQQASDWATAFGGKGAKAQNVASQLMPSQDFGGGLKGYSSYGGYQDSLAKLKKNQPGLYDYITSMSIDPQTGAPAKMYQAAQAMQTPAFPGTVAPPPTQQPGTQQPGTQPNPNINPQTGLPWGIKGIGGLGGRR